MDDKDLTFMSTEALTELGIDPDSTPVDTFFGNPWMGLAMLAYEGWGGDIEL